MWGAPGVALADSLHPGRASSGPPRSRGAAGMKPRRGDRRTCRPSGASALCCVQCDQGVPLAFGSLHPWLPSAAPPGLQPRLIMIPLLLISLLVPAAEPVVAADA